MANIFYNLFLPLDIKINATQAKIALNFQNYKNKASRLGQAGTI